MFSSEPKEPDFNSMSDEELKEIHADIAFLDDYWRSWYNNTVRVDSEYRDKLQTLLGKYDWYKYQTSAEERAIEDRILGVTSNLYERIGTPAMNQFQAELIKRKILDSRN